MSDSIFLIVQEVHGPAGHGEPPMPYLALHTDGEWFSLGEPTPAFKTYEKAEEFLSTLIYSSYKIKEVPLL